MTSPKRRGIVTLALCGGIPEWPKGADCKSVVTDFGGSNPPSPTSEKTAVLLSFLSSTAAFILPAMRLVPQLYPNKINMATWKRLI